MTAHVRDWLPVEVANRPKVRDAIARLVRDWSQDWFTGQQLEATRFRPVADGQRMRGEGDGWRVYGGTVAISVTPHAITRMASWMLDAPLARLELTPGDTAVVDALEHRLLGDLAERMEALLGLPPRERDEPERADRLFDGRDGIEIAVTDGSGALIVSLALSFEALLPFCKASLPAAKSLEQALGGLRGALGVTPVIIEATLGHVEIGMIDLRKLVKGDVLVLDRELDAGVHFDLPGSEEPFAVAYLGESAGRMTLTLQRDQD